MTPPTKPTALTPIFENIPAELREYSQFVVWKFDYVEGKEGKEEKWAKVPYSPLTGRRARTHDAANPKSPYREKHWETWGSFDEAKSRYQRGGYDGIGFVFTEGDQFVGGDIDHCIGEDGALKDTAAFALPFVNTYTEISPSGTGVKFIARASTVPGGKGNKKKDVEMYPHGRYFTLTGHRMPDYPATVEARQGEINTLHEIWFGKELPKLPPRPIPSVPTSLDDTEVLKRAERDTLFDRLWRGDTSGYTSQSSADFALCGKLLFYIGSPDTGRVDRLFRQSGLLRGKWDEQHGSETYGERTLRKAVEGRTDYYGQSSDLRYNTARAANEIAKTGAAMPPTFDTLQGEEYTPESEGYTHQYTPPECAEIPAENASVSAGIEREKMPENSKTFYVDTAPIFEIETGRTNHPRRVISEGAKSSDLMELCPDFSDVVSWENFGQKLHRLKLATDEYLRWSLGAWYESLTVQHGGKMEFVSKLFGTTYAKNIMDHYAPTFRAWREIGRQDGVPFWLHETLQGVEADEEKLRWCSEYRDRGYEARTSGGRKALTREEVRERLNIPTLIRPAKGWDCPKRAEIDSNVGELIAQYAEMAGRVEVGMILKQFLKEKMQEITPKEDRATIGEDGLRWSDQELVEEAQRHIETVYRQAAIEEGRPLSAIETEIEAFSEEGKPPENLALYIHSNTVLENSAADTVPTALRFAPDVLPPVTAAPDEEPEPLAQYAADEAAPVSIPAAATPDVLTEDMPGPAICFAPDEEPEPLPVCFAPEVLPDEVTASAVRQAWIESRLDASPALFARILGREVSSCQETVDNCVSADLAALLLYGLTGKIAIRC